MAGLMDILQQPETWQWLGGVGQQLDASARGQGFDLTRANAGLMQGIQDRQRKEQMQGLMSGMDLTDQQRTWAQSNLELANEYLGKQLFPKAGANGAEYGYNIVWGRDANDNLVPMQPGRQGGLRPAAMPEGVEAILPYNTQMLDTGTGYAPFDPRRPAATPPGPAAAQPGFVAKDLAGVETAKTAARMETEATTEASIGLPTRMITGRQMLKTISDLRNDPYLSSMVGWRDYLTDVTPAAARVRARLDQLAGANFMEAYVKLKGGGQITEVEGRKAEQAAARLSTAQSEEDFKAALADLEKIVQAGLSEAKRKANPKDAEIFGGIDIPDAVKRDILRSEPGDEFQGPDGTVYVWDGRKLAPK